MFCLSKGIEMEELLKSKDILAEPRVVAAWHGLRGVMEWDEQSYEPIPGHINIYKAAFGMRDALCPEDMRWIWERLVGECSRPMLLSQAGSNSYALRHADPIHWIVAATICYEEGQNA